LKDTHSRLGDANEDYDNCSYHGSTSRLSKEKKFELELNSRAATAAPSALVETVAPHVGHVGRAAPGSCAVRTCAISSFLGGGSEVVAAVEQLCRAVEARVMAEAHRAQQQEAVAKAVVPEGRNQCGDKPVL
jgi:hypothetical protein